MRFNVVGDDPETGHSLEIAVEASTPEEAASVAQRRNIQVMSVTPAEAVQIRPRAERRGRLKEARTEAVEQGARFRQLAAFVLFVAFFTSFSVPAATGVVGIAILGCVFVFAFIPGARDRVRVVLGVWPQKPVWGVLRLSCLVTYGLLLVALANEGFEDQARSRKEAERANAEQAERQEQRKQADANSRSLLAELEGALRQGDLTTAHSLAETAMKDGNASTRKTATALLSKINGATSPEYAVDLLVNLPQDQFEAFRSQPAEFLPLGFPVLDDSVTRNARAHMDEALARRADRLEGIVSAARRDLSDAQQKYDAFADQVEAMLQMEATTGNISSLRDYVAKGKSTEEALQARKRALAAAAAALVETRLAQDEESVPPGTMQDRDDQILLIAQKVSAATGHSETDVLATADRLTRDLSSLGVTWSKLKVLSELDKCIGLALEGMDQYERREGHPHTSRQEDLLPAMAQNLLELAKAARSKSRDGQAQER